MGLLINWGSVATPRYFSVYMPISFILNKFMVWHFGLIILVKLRNIQLVFDLRSEERLINGQDFQNNPPPKKMLC